MKMQKLDAYTHRGRVRVCVYTFAMSFAQEKVKDDSLSLFLLFLFSSHLASIHAYAT